MSRQKLIDLICFKYGLTMQQADQYVDRCFNRGYTWLDVVRQLDFNTRINQYNNYFA